MTDAKTLALVREALAEFACSNNDACYCDQVRVSDKETCRYRKAAAALAALDAEGEPTDLRKVAEQARDALTRVPHLRVDADTSDAITDALAAIALAEALGLLAYWCLSGGRMPRGPQGG